MFKDHIIICKTANSVVIYYKSIRDFVGNRGGAKVVFVSGP